MCVCVCASSSIRIEAIVLHHISQISGLRRRFWRRHRGRLCRGWPRRSKARGRWRRGQRGFRLPYEQTRGDGPRRREWTCNACLPRWCFVSLLLSGHWCTYPKMVPLVLLMFFLFNGCLRNVLWAKHFSAVHAPPQ